MYQKLTIRIQDSVKDVMLLSLFFIIDVIRLLPPVFTVRFNPLNASVALI